MRKITLEIFRVGKKSREIIIRNGTGFESIVKSAVK